MLLHARRLCTAAARPKLFEMLAEQPLYGVGSRVYRTSWAKKEYKPEDHHYLVTKTHLVRTPSHGRLRARLWLTGARSRGLCVRRIARRRGAS